MNEYERNLVTAAKRRIKELRDHPEALTSEDNLQVIAAIALAADDSHITELVSEAAARNPAAVRTGIAVSFRGGSDGIERALFDLIADQLQPFQDAAIQEIQTSQRTSDIREIKARGAWERQRDLACEARRAGL